MRAPNGRFCIPPELAKRRKETLAALEHAARMAKAEEITKRWRATHQPIEPRRYWID